MADTPQETPKETTPTETVVEEKLASIEEQLSQLRTQNLDVAKAKANLELEPLLNKDVFKNRRRMGWTALIAMILAFGYLVLGIPPLLLEHYGELTSWFFIAMTSVVAAYMGTTIAGTLFAYRGKKNTDASS